MSRGAPSNLYGPAREQQAGGMERREITWHDT